MTAADGRAARRQVAVLLDDARDRLAGRDDAATALDGARRRLDEPLRVALAGKVKAGKSTLLNALVGARLAATDTGECTRIVTWYRDGLTYGVTAHGVDGRSRRVAFRRADDALHVDLGPGGIADVERLEVTWPARPLRAMTLIDTPGIGSVTGDAAARTHAHLTPADGAGGADAVCYLMRHLHALDARFLEAFRDRGVGGDSPLNAVAVLSRADEIGGGRLAALQSAAGIADRYRGHPQVRQLCQTVLPVAGLLAETAATLREDEYAALSSLVGLDRDRRDTLLLSVDRFTAPDAEVDLTADVRRALLARFGVFGVRLAIALIRSRRATTATALAAALTEQSGIATLRTTLLTQFAERADLLKARSGLATLAGVLDAHPGSAADDLRARIERIVHQTHAFAEARLLNALRAGAVRLDDAAAADAERLLGGRGTEPADRLGAPDDTPVTTLHAAAVDALERWRRRAALPLAAPDAVEAAGVVARSCEGVIMQLRAVERQPVHG